MRNQEEKMNSKIAKHILGSANIEELKDSSSWMPANAKESGALKMPDRVYEAKLSEFESDLREAGDSVGVTFRSEKDLSKAKERLLLSMSVAAGLVGLGEKGDYMRSADFHGTAGAGSLSEESLSEMVNPERPHRKGSQWMLKESSRGLEGSLSKSMVSDSGLVAVNQRSLAAKAVSKIDHALGGFEPIWEALNECASNHQRLGGLARSDCWSKTELSSYLDASLSSRLEPFSMDPESDAFPKPIDSVDFGAKLEARREAASGAPKVSSPKSLLWTKV